MCVCLTIRWWIPTAIKVLALMNAANNLSVPPVIDYAEFYNVSLDHMDLMQVIPNVLFTMYVFYVLLA